MNALMIHAAVAVHELLVPPGRMNQLIDAGILCLLELGIELVVVPLVEPDEGVLLRSTLHLPQTAA